ncbi:MAG: GNAT family N-acetyltransferase [Thermodesulfobacteriota bacterium]
MMKPSQPDSFMGYERKGPRLLIRPFKSSDADDLYRHVQDEAIARWTLRIPHPYPRDGARKFIRQSMYNRRRSRTQDFGIVPASTGKVIGAVSLMNINLTDKSAELGYWLGVEYWGRGLATEAVDLILGLGFREMNLNRIEADVFMENAASQRVLEKAGFAREGVSRQSRYKHGCWHDMWRYGILRPEFEAR